MLHARARTHISALTLTLTLTIASLSAQISSPSANGSKLLSYPVYSGNDMAFAFYSPSGTEKGSLIASLLPNAGLNFDWTQYNQVSGNFDIPLLSETGLSQSTLSNLGSGGYRVHLYNGVDVDTSFTAWVFIDKLQVSVTKDFLGQVPQTYFTCDFLTLSGFVTPDTFRYYDPVSKEEVIAVNGFTFLWTSDNPDLKIPNASRVLDPNTTYKPPYKDTWYILTATDSFGVQGVDSVLYISNQVGPDPVLEPWFTMQMLNKEVDPRVFEDAPSPVQGDAPMIIKFTNKSINGFSYEWIYSDSARSDIFSNEFTTSVDYQPEHIYKIPNDYYPALVVTSAAGCIDTFSLTDPIVVLPSILEVPNVFSPNEDGLNDFFNVKSQSIKEFDIRIFDRAGKLVYKEYITDMYTWDGWNGNVLNSTRKASPGVYFWVITPTGWDSKSFGKEVKRGTVYLYR